MPDTLLFSRMDLQRQGDKTVPSEILVAQTDVALSGIYSDDSCLGVGANATCLYWVYWD